MIYFHLNISLDLIPKYPAVLLIDGNFLIKLPFKSKTLRGTPLLLKDIFNLV